MRVNNAIRWTTAWIVAALLLAGCTSKEEQVKQAAAQLEPVEARFDPVAGVGRAIGDTAAGAAEVAEVTVKGAGRAIEVAARQAARLVSQAASDTTEAVEATGRSGAETVEAGAEAVAKTAGDAAAAVTSVARKRYEPTWESLDTRPTPAWFAKAKFGIFIHWGVYSVPAWGPKVQYAEWYWRRAFTDDQKLQNNAWGAYHKRVYGEDFPYKDFAPMFTCELFDPDQWADIFYRSGAKYVVLTSKHHEGFCLWPSAEASRTWGRPWNAVEIGPKRDLLGDLTAAVRRRGLKMGYYYSLYEWFNPLWLDKSKRGQYVTEHMLPQLKDLVTRYQPDIVWTDGEWDMPAENWHSTEFLAWLFNESPVRDTVAINDRWGKGCRHKHGGYYTTEYGAGLADASHPWEECRGMGHSFGYNRNESIDDYKSARELLLVLIDLTSRGGCLLLDIGPTGDGRIPVIMQQRLIEMGDWLAVNGEAIYETVPWRRDCQWSEGKRPQQEYKEYKAKYNVLDVVGAASKNGRAVKQAFFTSKPGMVYAILPAWPGKRFLLRDVTPAEDVTVRLLGRPGTLPWKRSPDGMMIDLSNVKVRELPSRIAWTLKIEGEL